MFKKVVAVGLVTLMAGCGGIDEDGAWCEKDSYHMYETEPVNIDWDNCRVRMISGAAVIEREDRIYIPRTACWTVSEVQIGDVLILESGMRAVTGMGQAGERLTIYTKHIPALEYMHRGQNC